MILLGIIDRMITDMIDREAAGMGNSSGLIGIAIVAGFIIIVVLCVIADSNSKKKFTKKIRETYKIKDKSGQLILTTDNEIIFSVPSGTLPGYKLFNLEDIAYVGFYKDRGNRTFSFLDDGKNAMKGEYLTPSKKPLLQKKQAAFPMNADDEELIYGFISKYKPDAVKIVNGNISG